MMHEKSGIVAQLLLNSELYNEAYAWPPRFSSLKLHRIIDIPKVLEVKNLMTKVTQNFNFRKKILMPCYPRVTACEYPRAK